MFALPFTSEAAAVVRELEEGGRYRSKLDKVRSCLGRLERDPNHPGSHVHRYRSITGLGGEAVWEVYVENRTPSAWRMWFWYGPDRDMISILFVGPHP